MSQLIEVSAEDEAEMVCAALGITLEDLMRELQYRQRKKESKMRKRMALAAKAGGVRRMLKDTGDGGGYQDMMIDPISYHYWGQRLGYECWDDAQFIREYKRDNPESRVKTVGSMGLETIAMRLTKAKPAAPMAAPRLGRRGRWAA
jgi:hypothetical protein